MRKLKLVIQTSVDGYIADINGKTDWMIWNWGEDWTWDVALQQDFNDLKSAIGGVLISREMAVEGFIDHWANAAARKDSPQSGFAQQITNAPKIVFTKTLDKSIWPNTVLAKGDLTGEVNKLKNQPGKDLIAYGGASFASSLIKAGLIDEYYLFMNPVALGQGMDIFHGPGRNKLTLITAKSYSCGMVLLKYIPTAAH
jgi:dihydrofolate reductase